MRILLVEDQEVLRRALARSLRLRGEVDEADRLHSALSKVARAIYDVVITDDELPDGSGRVLLERVRRLHSRCRRVLMSATNVLTDREPFPAYEHFFLKPDELVLLISWLDRVRLLGPRADEG